MGSTMKNNKFEASQKGNIYIYIYTYNYIYIHTYIYINI